MSLQDYLIEFKDVAAEWFEGCAFIKDNYDFFTEFFKKENLVKLPPPEVACFICPERYPVTCLLEQT